MNIIKCVFQIQEENARCKCHEWGTVSSMVRDGNTRPKLIPPPSAIGCFSHHSSHCKMTYHVSPRPLLISAKGAPQLFLHIHSLQSVSLLFSLFFFTQCVCTCFPSPSPSLPLSEDLTFFPLGSHCVLTRAFVTRHPLSVTEHSVLPVSSFLFFSTHSIIHSLFVWLHPCYTSIHSHLFLVCAIITLMCVDHPSLRAPLFFLESPSVSSILSHASPVSLCLVKQREPCDLFSVAALWTFTASLLLSKSGTCTLKITHCLCLCTPQNEEIEHFPCQEKMHHIPDLHDFHPNHWFVCFKA